tara:strand:- start:1164 stop:1778 length:615 start_codon:yes stop_codon:yes gene_type:complete
MDILGGMSNTNDSQQVYLSFKTSDQKFFLNGETPIEFTYMQLDPATFKSGWGRYVGEYQYQWDAKFGVMDNKPSDDYKRAFSCWVLPQGHSHPLLWQRFTYAESSAFNKILSTFWNQKDTAGDNLPVVKFEGSKAIQVGMGKSSELNFSFAKFAPRANEFVIPEWYDKEDKVEDSFKSPNAGLQDAVNNAVNESNTLLEDDIPF